METFAAVSLMGLAASAAAVSSCTLPWPTPADFLSGITVWKGDRDSGKIALTFDDGPDPGFTPGIMKILDRFSCRATFFVMGKNVEKHRKLANELNERGHELANHSYSHEKSLALRPSSWESEINGTRKLLEGITGKHNSLFRPPHGIRTPPLLRWLARNEYRCVFWTVMPLDYLKPGHRFIVSLSGLRLKSGGILTLHDGNGDRSQTVTALEPIIELLLDRELNCVTISDLLEHS